MGSKDKYYEVTAKGVWFSKTHRNKGIFVHRNKGIFVPKSQLVRIVRVYFELLPAHEKEKRGVCYGR